ncbi:hypothetical protein [Caballeronia sp. LZ032]|uniref:hypothetical protein n=1 Tax=Caballeronia sp. LZ032 TaxID=3038565 RepID=UPI0038D44651
MTRFDEFIEAALQREAFLVVGKELRIENLQRLLYRLIRLASSRRPVKDLVEEGSVHVR